MIGEPVAEARRQQCQCPDVAVRQGRHEVSVNDVDSLLAYQTPQGPERVPAPAAQFEAAGLDAVPPKLGNVSSGVADKERQKEATFVAEALSKQDDLLFHRAIFPARVKDDGV